MSHRYDPAALFTAEEPPNSCDARACAYCAYVPRVRKLAVVCSNVVCDRMCEWMIVILPRVSVYTFIGFFYFLSIKGAIARQDSSRYKVGNRDNRDNRASALMVSNALAFNTSKSIFIKSYLKTT